VGRSFPEGIGQENGVAWQRPALIGADVQRCSGFLGVKPVSRHMMEREMKKTKGDAKKVCSPRGRWLLPYILWNAGHIFFFVSGCFFLFSIGP
jgi:hypothetical protein